MSASPIASVTPNFIAGEFLEGNRSTLEVLSPIDGKEISKVILSEKEDLKSSGRSCLESISCLVWKNPQRKGSGVL